MEGAAIRVILSNPQHGWNKESTPSEILGDTPEMSGSHQHGAEKKNASWLRWLNEKCIWN